MNFLRTILFFFCFVAQVHAQEIPLVPVNDHPPELNLIPVELPFVPSKIKEKPKYAPSAISTDCVAALSGVRADQIVWNLPLNPNCQVSGQGQLGSCWANATAELFNQSLVKVGLLKPGERLSVDYYTALSMRAKATEFRMSSKAISMDLLNGDIPFAMHGLLKNDGVVLDSQFKFPQFLIRPFETATRANAVDIRRSAYLRKQLVEELNANRRNPLAYVAVLDRFLGNTGDANRLPRNRFLLGEAKPRLVEPKEKAGDQPWLVNLIIKFWDSQSQQNFSEIQRLIRKNLDEGLIVEVDLKNISDSFNLMNTTGTSLYESPLNVALKPNPYLKKMAGEKAPPPDGHAVLITNYHLDENGKPDWYLIQNSWGTAWGVQGTAAVSSDYLYTHATSFLF